MFGLFKEVSKYLNGGNVSVDGGREGDWLEDKFAGGGVVIYKELDLNRRDGKTKVTQVTTAENYREALAKIEELKKKNQNPNVKYFTGDIYAKGGGVYHEEKISAYQTKSGRYKKDIWGKILFNMPDGTQNYYYNYGFAVIDWLKTKKYNKKDFREGDFVVLKHDIESRYDREKKKKVIGFDGNYLIIESANKASVKKNSHVSPSDVVFYSDIRKHYAVGGAVSVDGGREGDWLEDKYGTGGRIKDSEINVGNRFGLINGEVVEIKKRFIDPRYKGDDRVVVFTRSSDGKEHENTVDTLRIFLNNTKAQLINKHTEEVLGEKYWTKYGNGGKVTYVGDYKTDTRTYYFRRYNNAIGSFGWKYNDKYNEGILYALDEYDKEYVGNVSLKNNEYIFRYKTDRMIGDAKYIIKINLDNALVYFLSEKGIELDEPIFESRGIKADYIIIDKTKISFKSIFSKGGEFEEEIWQIRNSAGKYYSRTMSGAENWSDSPDMGYTYTRQIGESIINILKKSGYTDLYLVKYDKDWYKKKDGGEFENDTAYFYDKIEYGSGGAIKSKEIITKKIGFSEEVADYFVSQSEKFAVWLADIILKEALLNNPHVTKKEFLESHRASVNHIRNNYGGAIREILDWLQHPITPKQDLRKLDFETALEKAREWHEELEVLGGDIDFTEPNENLILKTYPETSEKIKYYWVYIPSNFCSLESSRMGHCGRTGYGNKLISLRSVKPYGKGHTISDSHVTIAYGENGIFYQVKGKKNQKPAEKYYPYIFDLIKSLIKGDLEKADVAGIQAKIKEIDEELRKIAEDFKVIDKNTAEFSTKVDAFNYLVEAKKDLENTLDKKDVRLSFSGFGKEYGSSEDYGFEDMTKEQIRELYELDNSVFSDNKDLYRLFDTEVISKEELIEKYENNKSDFSSYKDKVALYDRGIITERPSTIAIIEKDCNSVVDLLDVDRDTRDSVVEAVLCGDLFDYWDSNDYYYENASDLVDNLNKENENRVIEEIVRITGKSKEEVEENGIEYYLNGEDEEFDEDYFENIKSALARSQDAADQADYHNHIYKELENSLDELGKVIYLNDEGVKLEVDLSNYLSDTEISDYMENIGSDSLEDVFYEALGNDIGKPDFGIDSRYSPYGDDEDFNDYFSDVDLEQGYERGGKFEDGGILSEDIQMAKSDVMKLEEYAKKISDNVMPNQDIEAWVISKISKVEQTTANVKHTLESQYPEMFASGGEIENTDGNTVRMMCLHIGKYAKSMLKAIDNGVVFESWMTHELSIAGNMIDSVYHYLDYFNSGNHLAHGGGIKNYAGGGVVIYKELDLNRRDGKKKISQITKVDSYREAVERIEELNKKNTNPSIRYFTGDIYHKGGGFYISAEEYRDILDAMSSERLAQEYFTQKGIAISYNEAEDEREDITDALVNEYVRTMKSRGERGFKKGGEMVKHLDIPNTMLDFTLKTKMAHGGEMNKYQLGDMWSDDFDYEGMLQMALTINENWSIGELQSLYDSFEDVNYHTVNSYLSKIINYIENGNKNLAKAYIIIYKKKIAELLADEYSEQEQEASQMVMGGSLAQKRKVGKVMHEFKHGKLKSNDRIVTDRNQAIAIALSEAGISKKEEGGMIENFKLPTSDFVPITNGGIPSYNTPLDHWALYYEQGGEMGLDMKKYKVGERFYDEMGNEYRYAYYQRGKGHWLNDMKNNGILVFGGLKEIPNRFSKINKALL